MEDDKIETNGLGEQPMPVSNGYVEPTVESVCSEIMAELMNDEQQAINSMNYKIGRLKALYEKTGREDILNCINEIKEKQLADETNHWEIDKGWFEFFSGIAKKVEDDDAYDESGDDENELDADSDDGENKRE